MKISEFFDTLKQLKVTNSRNEKKDIIRGLDSDAAISFISGSEFDDIGLGKKSVHKVAQDVFGEFDPSPTVSEAVEDFDAGNESIKQSIKNVRDDMETLSELSGHEQQEYLHNMFNWYDEPAVVSHACLNDWPTGCSDKTIANALDLRDSLPFYDSVVEAAATQNPVTEPQVGKGFSPQLASPESSLPDWQN